MAFYIVDAIFQVSKTFSQINLQKISEQVFQITAKMSRESYLQEHFMLILESSLQTFKFTSQQWCHSTSTRPELT